MGNFTLALNAFKLAVCQINFLLSAMKIVYILDSLCAQACSAPQAGKNSLRIDGEAFGKLAT